jgi:hypothetical protein
VVSNGALVLPDAELGVIAMPGVIVRGHEIRRVRVAVPDRNPAVARAHDIPGWKHTCPFLWTIIFFLEGKRGKGRVSAGRYCYLVELPFSGAMSYVDILALEVDQVNLPAGARARSVPSKMCTRD